MEGLYRWVAKHRLPAKIIMGVFLCGAYTHLLRQIEAPVWIIVVADLLLLFIIHAAVDSSIGALQKEPFRILHECCDPYPALEETREELSYPNSKSVQQMIQINYAVALRGAGRIQETWEVLDSIHIDEQSSTIPAMKVTYYNNLSDVLWLMGRDEEAQIWARKALQIYADMPDGRMKKSLAATMQTLEAECCMRKGEYAQALQYLQQVPSGKLSSQVSNALLQGKCYMALSDLETAREKLRFAAEKGYKLYTATQAKELLLELE